jgi:hypothetical protein
MQLVGQLSRPLPRLQAVLDLPKAPVGYQRPDDREQGRRLRNGAVQRAIVKVLMETGEPMRLSAIHAAVERLLDQPVSIESVSWCLRMDVKGKRLRFERVARGFYRLL